MYENVKQEREANWEEGIRERRKITHYISENVFIATIYIENNKKQVKVSIE